MISLVDIFPPEAQQFLGIISLVVAGVGVVLWMSGVKIARFSVAMVLGLLGAAAGVSQLTHDLSLSPVTAGLLGFVMGALLGAIAFRLLQGLVLAACIAIAAGGMYYGWHTTVSPPAPTVATAQDSGLIAQQLLIPTDRLSAQGPQASAAPSPVKAFTSRMIARWSALNGSDQRRISIIALSFGLAAFLLALAFQRPTTWIATAAIGSMLLLAGLQAAAAIYLPQYEHFFPSSALSWYLALTLLTALGLLIQYKYFWPKSNRPKPLPRLENPLYRGPQAAPQS